MRAKILHGLIVGLLLLSSQAGADEPLAFIRVSPDKRGFVQGDAGTPFVPRGFNYDHDAAGRLLEDYWIDEWETVVGDFVEMKVLKANVVRIHLQFGKFMDAADKPNEKSLAQLKKLLRLAEEKRLYVDLTGLGCYHKADVPAWYDALSESDRWQAQAHFWKAVAGVAKDSPAVFCYDLMNEPVAPGGKSKDGDWLGPAFGGKHFVQRIALDQGMRTRPEIAKAWIDHLCAAVRSVDKRHLITVGLVDWSLDRKGLTSGFVPAKTTESLDFLCVHIYPETGKLDAALETLKGFNIGKPVVIEETFPLKCSLADMQQFMKEADPHAAGWISFYWGTPPAELKESSRLDQAILSKWLEVFP